MKVNRPLGLFATIVVICGLFALGDSVLAAAKPNHNNGQQLLGAKIKTNGIHVIHKKGNYTASVEVKDGKVAGVHVKNGQKGDTPVKKYKTNKNPMSLAGGHVVYASLVSAQDQYIGTLWIGYAYVDDYGYEEIYWFPYDMILDGDTGAIWFIPA